MSEQYFKILLFGRSCYLVLYFYGLFIMRVMFLLNNKQTFNTKIVQLFHKKHRNCLASAYCKIILKPQKSLKGKIKFYYPT